MLAKYTIAGLAGSALLASVAFAQSPSATTDSANTDKATTATTSAPADAASLKGNWRTSKLVGLSVYNDNRESLGSINDLLTDKNGDIKAVVLGVGGFLGVGEHLVAVPFDKVKFVNEPVAYTGAAGAPNAGAAKTTNTTTPTTTTGAATTTTTSAKANPWYPDHAVYNATKDQLKAMTEFKYSTD
ncbi:MAG TPA: PRC-barrel domain-containing protein [Bradyrhizobium sp.]|jgi:sporulation protein YlmC with PRC-barrel domain